MHRVCDVIINHRKVCDKSVSISTSQDTVLLYLAAVVVSVYKVSQNSSGGLKFFSRNYVESL